MLTIASLLLSLIIIIPILVIGLTACALMAAIPIGIFALPAYIINKIMHLIEGKTQKPLK